MANRKGKVCRFIPYQKEEKPKDDLEKEKVRLDIEILRSIRYKFKDDSELKSHFDKIIGKLIKSIRK
jgi:hypothetical protein